jgi:hypothetical protein
VSREREFELDEVEKIVTVAYRTLERYARTSGTPVTFELSDFRTILRPDWTRTRAADLLTFAGGRSLQFDVTRFQEEGTPGISYRARWADSQPTSAETLRALQGMSAEEAYTFAAQEIPRMARAVALTTYQVRAEFAGESRTYRAVFLWIPANGKKVDFMVTDWVTQRVDEAILERVPAAALVPGGGGPRPITAPLLVVPCVEESMTLDSGLYQVPAGTSGHSSGSHSAAARFEATCVCQADCYNKCQPTVAYENCLDTGEISGFFRAHVTRTKADQVGGTKRDGGAKCSAGYACYIQDCSSLGCGSSLTITATPTPTGISYTSAGGTVVMEGGMSHVFECGNCTSTDPVGTPSSPLLLDLDNGGFTFTDAADGVRFDLDADGRSEQTAWTVAGSGDGFLWLDRDADGFVDGGGELFGDHTPQPFSANPNGFLALAVFDQAAAGGNGDAAITAEDSIFPLLRVWVDANHDGSAQSQEVKALAELGISRLELAYIESRRRDPHGNELRYRGSARKNHRLIQVVDVIFLRE